MGKDQQVLCQTKEGPTPERLPPETLGERLLITKCSE